MLKLVTIVVACVLTVLTVRKIMQQLAASAAKVKVERPRAAAGGDPAAPGSEHRRLLSRRLEIAAQKFP